ncbi:MAG: Fic family protein [Gemmatimonadales bacterium]|nr:Fic family protein [Gemmatimonadales bacterium]
MRSQHPWSADYPFLSFDFNARKIPPRSWALLGECSSKIEHVMGTPLQRDVADELNKIFLARGAHGTTAIEGNTLSEAQVKRRVDGDLHLPPTQEYLGKEVDNVLAAYDFLLRQLDQGVPIHLRPEDLKQMNRLVLDGLGVEEGVVPGEYREGRVGVSDYLSPERKHLEEMVSLGCAWLNHDTWGKEYGGPFVIPILRAILSHLYIAWMHPFGDGNGRTARLVEFDLLIRAGVPIACAHLLSDHYNKTRTMYYRALSAAREDPAAFVCYAIEGLRDMLREQIDVIRTQQIGVTWTNYIYSAFRTREESVTAKRRRDLALALGAIDGAVSMDKLTTLTPKLAQAYHQRTYRTLQRDVMALVEQHLLVPSAKGVRANLGLVRAFMPAKGAALQPEESERRGPGR